MYTKIKKLGVILEQFFYDSFWTERHVYQLYHRKKEMKVKEKKETFTHDSSQNGKTKKIKVLSII